jgi:CBS-domain-containing membrane protein
MALSAPPSSGRHMARFDRAIDKRFVPHWPNYVVQSAMATVAVLLVLVALRHQNLVVAASLAATTFTVFTIPSSVTASPRNVIGGHLVGLIFGTLFALLPQETGIRQDLIYAVAVGGSMFLMSITNTEHPPAAGTALGVVIAGYSTRTVLGVLVGVAILVTVHRLLRPFLRDLIAAPEATELEE